MNSKTYWKPFSLEKKTPQQIAAVDQLWKKADLSFLLHPGQQRIRDWFYDKPQMINVLNCARQFGKSFLMVALCVEQCLRQPYSQVRYGAPTLGQTQRIVIPNMNMLMRTCPPQMRPRKSGECWTFPNGSELWITGVDKDSGERLRGSFSHLIVLDECAFMSNLEYLVDSISIPQFTTTNGRLLMVSTPPVSKLHAFTKRFIAEAIPEGRYVRATYKDNPMLTQVTLDNLVKSVGGANTEAFKRELLADHTITDQKLRVVPNYVPDTHRAFFEQYKRPELFQPYVGIDPAYGGTHSTGLVFGHYDYKNGYLVIEEDCTLRNNTISELAVAIKQIEARLWRRTGNQIPLPEPYRICDSASPIIPNGLTADYGLRTERVVKTNNKLGPINSFRDYLRDGMVWINPETCPTLSNQLQDGVWYHKRDGNEFAKDPDGTHLDNLMALVYLCRHVRWSEDPYQRVDRSWMQQNRPFIHTANPSVPITNLIRGFR